MAYELGTAYVQIMPSAKGIKGNIEKALGNGGDAGQTYGNGLVSMLKKVIIGAGIGKALSATISEGAKLQQSLGGVETMFKENAEKVIRNSESAYRRAGVSQNEYLESLTSFSASLIQSLGGDTAKATEIADKAMVDMSDNANKYGTNIADIQRAYQGFAKQNYTMLDRHICSA